MMNAASRRLVLVQSCYVFLALIAVMLVDGYDMFTDSDPLWHVAAGQLIRSTGTIPYTDPWSFTAGDYRWLNVAWLWDIAFSWIHDRWGWHGAIVINMTIVALALSITYANCVIRSHNGMASIVAVILLFVLLYLHLRPLQITHLMIAIWALALGLWVRGECRFYWLALLPLSMIFWVNSHGGFVLGFALLAAYGIHTLLSHQRQRIIQFSFIGLLCLGAIFVNPYGIDIIETVRRPLFTNANDYISEWRPIAFTLYNMTTLLFVVLFVIMVPGRSNIALPAERWLAYVMLVYALSTNRALPAFAIIAAPWLAYRMAGYFKESANVTPLALAIRARGLEFATSRTGTSLSLLICAAITLALPGPIGQKLVPQKAEWTRLKEEIDYIDTNHSDKRFLNEFLLGGYLAYETRGRIPVFVDPRTETAYPAKVMEDYFRFHTGEKGWEEILETYHIDGIIVPNNADDHRFHDRFDHRVGWKKAFVGPSATIYLRVRD